MPSLRPPVTSLSAESSGFDNAESVGAAPSVASPLGYVLDIWMSIRSEVRMANSHRVLNVVKYAGHRCQYFTESRASQLSVE